MAASDEQGGTTMCGSSIIVGRRKYVFRMPHMLQLAPPKIKDSGMHMLELFDALSIPSTRKDMSGCVILLNSRSC